MAALVYVWADEAVQEERVVEFRDVFFSMYQAQPTYAADTSHIEVHLVAFATTPTAFNRRENDRVLLLQQVKNVADGGRTAAAQCVNAIFYNIEWTPTQATETDFSPKESGLVFAHSNTLETCFPMKCVKAALRGDVLFLLSDGAATELKNIDATVMLCVNNDPECMTAMHTIISQPLFTSSISFAALSCILRRVYMTGLTQRNVQTMLDKYKRLMERVVSLADPLNDIPTFWNFGQLVPQPLDTNLLHHARELVVDCRTTPLDHVYYSIASGLPPVSAFVDVADVVRDNLVVDGIAIRHVVNGIAHLSPEHMYHADAVAVFVARALANSDRLHEKLEELARVYTEHVDAPLFEARTEALDSGEAWFRRGDDQWSVDDIALFSVTGGESEPALLDSWTFASSGYVNASREKLVDYNGSMFSFAFAKNPAEAQLIDNDEEYEDMSVFLFFRTLNNFGEPVMDAMLSIAVTTRLTKYNDTAGMLLGYLARNNAAIALTAIYGHRVRMGIDTLLHQFFAFVAAMPIRPDESAQVATVIGLARAVYAALTGNLRNALNTLQTLVVALLSP